MSLRVLIANERFLARFGVDRILILLARHLVGAGIDVSFAFLRAETDMLRRISSSLIEVSLPEGLTLGETDRQSCKRLINAWSASRPDVIVSGGWPFFEVAARSSAFGVRSLFIDAGAVPHDGLPAEALPAQLELRRLRQKWLPAINTVAPISRFIRESQTEPDRGNSVGVTTVLLGGDHLPIDASPRGAGDFESKLSGIGDAPLICLLGRYEAFGYKNSPAAFDVIRIVRDAVPNVRLSMLVGGDEVKVPHDIGQCILQFPTLTDHELRAVMVRSALGLSMSLWEGFNLPIVEMQSLDRPALAYNIGAHGEVIADPWLLCDTLDEMGDKAIQILRHGLPQILTSLGSFQKARERFRWSETLERWTDLVRQETLTFPQPRSRMVLMDVTNSARDPGNSGVIRVTRRLGAELERRDDIDLLFVRWESIHGEYKLMQRSNFAFLASNAGPRDWVGRMADHDGEPVRLLDLIESKNPFDAGNPVLLLPEVILDGSGPARVLWARGLGLSIAALLHDLLPVYHAEHIDKAVQDAFPSYLLMLSGVDRLWSNSNFSLTDFSRYVADNRLRPPGRTDVVWLPGQFSDQPRSIEKRDILNEINVICVSTLEPRKNHRTLVKAFLDLLNRRADLRVRLILIGSSYAGAEDLADYINDLVRTEPRIVWKGVLSDRAIAEIYMSVSFSVYPSLVEGFGLPVLESLWMGCPCICNNVGVMNELAENGGCLTVDMSDAAALSVALEELATNAELRATLTEQARSRTISDWPSYAEKIAVDLIALKETSAI